MASEKGLVATEAPLVSPAAPPTSVLQPPAAPDTVAADAGRANSLKRPRDTTPTSPTAPAGGLAHPDVSPSKFARLIDSTRYSGAAPLTGQAALDDELRRNEEEARLHPPDAVSENPAQQALALLRGVEVMSRANDGPAAAPSAADAATTRPAHPVIVPPGTSVTADNQSGVSPQSVTSGQSLGSGHVVHSPAPMDVDSRNERPGYLQPDAQMEEKPGSMSYPGIMSPSGVMPAPAAPARGMSLPTSSQNPDIAPRSPSSKKHKCPFCDTEFTRHHNLKSHLLTHSQEKPYVCQDCQMRFRRLHDLKRHSKLHTGEKPHICPKCDRKFARGDALARHSKGAGGCAGRRSSMGSFAGEDDYEGASTEADDSAMVGVVYDGHEDMTEEERRRLSLPSIKAQHVSGSGGVEGYAPHSRTYPPAGPRTGTAGGLYPPSIDRVPPASSSTSPSMLSSSANGHTPSTSISSMPMSAGSTSLYSYGMTESPKPLSPSGPKPPPGQDSANPHRARSPSLTAQLQQQQYARRQSELTSPHSAAQGPSPTSLPSMQPNVGGAHSRASSGPSHGHSGGSGDSSVNLFASDSGMWAYIQSLESRLHAQDDKIRQQEEQLRQQAERITALETTKQGHETQLSYLASDTSSLRGQVVPPRAPPLEPQEQPPPPKN